MNFLQILQNYLEHIVNIDISIKLATCPTEYMRLFLFFDMICLFTFYTAMQSSTNDLIKDVNSFSNDKIVVNFNNIKFKFNSIYKIFYNSIKWYARIPYYFVVNPLFTVNHMVHMLSDIDIVIDEK